MMSNTKQQNPPDPVEMLYIESPSISLKQFREAIDRLVTEARMNELEMLPHKVFDCSPLIHLGYTFDEHTDRIAELQSQLTNKEEK